MSQFNSSLNNPSMGGKPDFSKAFAFSSFPYTAPEDGFFSMTGYMVGSGGEIFIDGQSIAYNGGRVNYWNGGLMVGLTRISKGQVITHSMAAFRGAVFYPLKA